MSGLVVEFAPGFGPLDVVGALDWVDLTDRLLEASWSEGRDDELEHYGPGQATIVLKNDDRQLDPDYTGGTWFGELLPRVPFRLREQGSQLDLPGAGGATASTPDHASFAVTDLDVRAHMAMDDWTPGGFGQSVAGQWGSAGNQSWRLDVAPSGVLSLHFTSNGTTDIGASSSAATGFTDGTYHWIRATLDVNDGGGNRVVKFYTSTDGVSWSQLGATVTTGGTITLFNSTATLAIGDVLGLAGNVRYVEVRDGIDGTIVAAADFSELGVGAKAFVDSTGKTWTVNGTAQIVADPATLFDRFYGFVESGFEQELHPPEMALCKVRLTDRLSAIGGLLPDVFDFAIQSLSPTGLWVLDGPSATEHVADTSGNGHDGEVVGDVKFGEPSVAPGHGTSAFFTADPDPFGPLFGRIELGRSPIIPDPLTVTVVATFKAPEAPADLVYTLFAQGSGGVQPSDKFTALSLATNGRLSFVTGLGSGAAQYQTAESVVDGEGHIAFAQSNGLAVDSTTLDSTTVVSGVFVINGVGIGGYAGINPNDHWLGWIGTVALWNSELTLSDREAILEGYTKLAGLRSDEHIAWALERIGVPAGLMNLDVGTVLMGTADTRGKDALAFIREVVATEQGEFYSDHRDGGKLRFRNRYARFTDSRSTTAQAAFSDDGTNVTAVRVERSGLDVAPNGIDGIVNQADVSWRGGSLSVEDAASAAAFGPQSRSVETQATTATQARSAGEWLVARYAQPRSRVRGLTTNAAASANARTAARRLRVGDRVTYRSHPQQVGSATVIDLFVEGIDHTMGDGTARTAVYHLAPVNTFVPWIWGTSEWDNETYWG